MQLSPWIVKTARAAALLVVVYVIGVASAAMSRGASARDTESTSRDFLAGATSGASAKILGRQELVDRFGTHPINRAELVGSYRVLARIVPLRQLEPRQTLPGWTYAVAEITPWPFIVRVDYGRFATFSYGPCGSAGTRLYLGFFGKVVLLREWPMVMW
jgi:hypothetical protein